MGSVLFLCRRLIFLVSYWFFYFSGNLIGCFGICLISAFLILRWFRFYPLSLLSRSVEILILLSCAFIFYIIVISPPNICSLKFTQLTSVHEGNYKVITEMCAYTVTRSRFWLSGASRLEPQGQHLDLSYRRPFLFYLLKGIKKFKAGIRKNFFKYNLRFCTFIYHSL